MSLDRTEVELVGSEKGVDKSAHERKACPPSNV
jgi:hypothetical protein